MIIKGRARHLTDPVVHSSHVSGVPAKRQRLMRLEQPTGPRFTAARQAGQDLWSGLPEELARKYEEARRVVELADWRARHKPEKPADPGSRAPETMPGPNVQSTSSDPEADWEAGR